MNLRAVVIARLADGVQSAPGNLLYCNADGLLTTSPADGVFLGVHAHEGPATPARDLQVIKAAGCVPVLVHAVGGTLCREGRAVAAVAECPKGTCESCRKQFSRDDLVTGEDCDLCRPCLARLVQEEAPITIKQATTPEDLEPMPPGEIRYLDPVDPELW